MRIKNLPIDRISQINSSDKCFIKNENIDFNTYFDDIVGVSLEENKDFIDLLLKFSPNRFRYVTSKPIHKSQKVVSEEEKIVLIEENNQLKDEVEDLKEYKLFKSMINNRTEDSMLLGQFGQLLKSNCPNLKTGRNLIFKYCKENNLVKVEYKENYATFYAVNNGWLMNVSDIVDGRGGTTLCNKIYITNKGCLYLGKKLFEDYLKSNI
jgi:hypothetical protein